MPTKTWREHDMSADMAKCDWLIAKTKDSKKYTQNLYAAMCNMRWQKLETWPVLTNELWSCTWRAAASIVASLRGEGDYLSWYASGINGDEYDGTREYVTESVVTDEIKEDLRQLGWHPVPYPEDDR